MISTGSMNMYTDAQVAYRRDRIQRDFAVMNQAARQRTNRRARAADVDAAGQLAPISEPARRLTWIARWHRIPRAAAH